jgi:hypothetical protein
MIEPSLSYFIPTGHARHRAGFLAESWAMKGQGKQSLAAE